MCGSSAWASSWNRTSSSPISWPIVETSRGPAMTPERWQRIGEIVSAALERDVGQRLSFLQRACDGDKQLRRDVEYLLSAHENARDFLERPLISYTYLCTIGVSETPRAGKPTQEARVGFPEARSQPRRVDRRGEDGIRSAPLRD